MMPNLPSLLAPEVVIMTTSNATSDGIVDIMVNTLWYSGIFYPTAVKGSGVLSYPKRGGRADKPH